MKPRKRTALDASQRRIAIAAAVVSTLVFGAVYAYLGTSAQAATGPDVVGAWTGKAVGAPYEPHLFTFHTDGTMSTTNPTNVQESASAPRGGTNDSVGMGAWYSSGGFVYGSFRQLNAYAADHAPAPDLFVTFRARVVGNRLTGDWHIPAFGETRSRGTLDFTRIEVTRWRPASASPTPTASTTTPAPTTPSSPSGTLTPSVSATPSPSPTPSPVRVKPDAFNTGVPAMTILSPYTGPCRITTPGAVISAKVVECDELAILTTGVVIERSVINGRVYADENSSTPVGFTITRSKINAPTGQTGLGAANYVADAVEVVGGNRSAYCYARCVINRSWLHAQYVPSDSDQHASGYRFDHDAKLIDSRVSCDALDNAVEGGCSASVTGYPDWGPNHHVTIEGNWIESTPGHYCAYGSWEADKPGNDDAGHATYIAYRDNVFSRGPTGRCGFGGPITSWPPAGREGNVWSGNRFDDGVVIPEPGRLATL